ncbi:ketopantoate reductase family protein [Glaciihabitans sp. dw_435]|uniref:ketopantoate reductase family protein n=1 Tax=Glaciihabitans sp. dw_435 TaxID=2720081 RepID=UPI001BD2EB1D|nr:2-dehydropantoate 2-reductase [Glaciihabitans sp. dw_435]
MRVGVIGAGAVGGTMAALLARAGHNVEVTARGDHLAAIRSTGLHLSGIWGEYTARVAANETLSERPELVIVTTKAQDAPGALRSNANQLGAIPLVIVQNGLDAIDTARHEAPAADILGGLALFAASYLSPGEVSVTGPGRTFLGGGLGDHALGVATRLLGAVMDVSAVENFRGAQWTKLVVNQINALPAITGLSAQEVIAHDGLRHLMTGSMRETVRIALASDVHFEELQGLSHTILRVFAAAPTLIAQELPKRLSARMGDIPNPGSTLQSIRRGQLTEIDYLNGAVVRAAGQIGEKATVNAALVDLVHEVERTGQFITPDEVVRRFRP